MEKKQEIQAKVTNLINSTSKMLTNLGDAVREQAVKGKEIVDHKLKERELNGEFRALGKDVFRLYAAGKLELPEETLVIVNRIKAMVEELSGAAQQPETTEPPPPPAEPQA